MALIGADPEALNALAAEFGLVAEKLDGIRTSVRVHIYDSAWQGPAAHRYCQAWDGLHTARLNAAMHELRDSARILRSDALEQWKASDAKSNGGRGLGSSAGLNPRQQGHFYRGLDKGQISSVALRAFPEMPWAIAEGKDELAAALLLSQDAQRAWWVGLGAERQRALMMAYPGAILALDGLPPDVLGAAGDQFLMSRLHEVEVSVRRDSVSGEVQGGLVEISAEASGTVTEYADGSATVTLSLSGDVGREFGGAGAEAELGAGGSVQVTYRFADPQTAQDFLANARDRLSPDFMRDVIGGDNLGSYLNNYSSLRESTTLGIEIYGEAEVKMGSTKMAIDGAVGGTYNLDTGGKTLYVEMGGQLSSGSDGIAYDGRVEMQVNAANQVGGATISLDASIKAGASIEATLAQFSGAEMKKIGGLQSGMTAGTDMHIDISINPNDPVVQRQMAILADNPANPVAMKAIVDRSTVEYSLSTTSTRSEGVSVGDLVSAKRTSLTSTNVVTILRPPGGEFMVVN